VYVTHPATAWPALYLLYCITVSCIRYHITVSTHVRGSRHLECAEALHIDTVRPQLPPAADSILRPASPSCQRHPRTASNASKSSVHWLHWLHRLHSVLDAGPAIPTAPWLPKTPSFVYAGATQTGRLTDPCPVSGNWAVRLLSVVDCPHHYSSQLLAARRACTMALRVRSWAGLR
jgi:hypothetical protein